MESEITAAVRTGDVEIQCEYGDKLMVGIPNPDNGAIFIGCTLYACKSEPQFVGSIVLSAEAQRLLIDTLMTKA
jgi:hypothetical protein